MKTNQLIKASLVCLGTTLSAFSWGQVMSPTMYEGTGNNPGSTGSYYGRSINATGVYSFGGGLNTNVTGAYSVGLGYRANVTGINSTGLGNSVDVTGSYAVGIGYNVGASGGFSMSLGTRNSSSGTSSVTLGTDLKSTMSESMTIGTGLDINNPLINNIQSSLMVGFDSPLSTFFVGPGDEPGLRGRVGISTTSPTASLEVANVNGADVDTKLNGFTLIEGEGSSLLFGNASGAPHGEWGIEAHADGLNFWNPFGAVNASYDNYRLFIANNGDVSIGTNDAKGYKLAVAGNVVAEAVVVKLQSNWPDFVFTNNYGLMELNEVESFISENSHLPNVPSAKEIEEGGINLGEMDAVLLQKIEELTLYVIDLKNNQEDLQEENKELRTVINDLKSVTESTEN